MTHKAKVLDAYACYRSDLSAETILDIMDQGRIFYISKTEEGLFKIGECCDGYYCVELTKDQLLTLSHELKELAMRCE